MSKPVEPRRMLGEKSVKLVRSVTLMPAKVGQGLLLKQAGVESAVKDALREVVKGKHDQVQDSQ